MNTNGHNLSLSDAASRYLAGLAADEAESNQQEVYRFVRWFGQECPMAGLTPPEVERYASQLSMSDTDYVRKLELIRGFLSCARKEGWTGSNLAVHLKVKKGKVRQLSAVKSREEVFLTKEGYAELEAELVTLKGKRTGAIDEIRRAAADKDFRENAPLEAAREQRGHIEGRIKELEETLKSARIIGDNHNLPSRTNVGDTVVLNDLASGEELSYVIVSPTEVDPARCKISCASPLGKAVVGRCKGEVIEVTVPIGKMRYQIKNVKR